MKNKDHLLPHYGKDKPYDGPEDSLQKETAKWLRLQHPKLLAYHTPNGGKRPMTTITRKGKTFQVPAIGRKLKEMGTLAGVPDWFIARRCHQYGGAYIELKAKGGALQDTQLDFLSRASDAGYYVAVAWSLDGFMQAVADYLSIPDEIELTNQTSKQIHNSQASWVSL